MIVVCMCQDFIIFISNPNFPAAPEKGSQIVQPKAQIWENTKLEGLSEL